MPFDRTQMAELSDYVIVEKGVPIAAMINSLLRWKSRLSIILSYVYSFVYSFLLQGHVYVIEAYRRLAAYSLIMMIIEADNHKKDDKILELQRQLEGL